MSMIIAHNLPGINTQRQFGVSARGMSSSMEKLSSGFKINTGKDDPSGLLISEKLRSQMSGITRAKMNTEEAMNVMGIAEGALNEMNNILKKMKSLATHSASNGVTTSDQIAANQSELDSAVQTMDRIAQTSEFARDKLLNGAKELTFEATTAIKGTQQNSLINVRESTFDQIFKRDGYSVSISYTGAAGKVGKLTDTGERVDFAKQASKAYLELDTAVSCSSASGAPNPKSQVLNGKFTQEQTFTLTGSKGSRQFSFGQNRSITEMVDAIQSSADSTGVGAALIFNSKQEVDALIKDTSADMVNGIAARDANSVAVFGSERYESNAATIAAGTAGSVKNGVTSVSGLTGVQWGKNTDGQGNIYVKYISDTEVELYKDSSMSKESLVASGKRIDATGVTKFIEANNSGLSGEMTIARDNSNDGNPEKRSNLADLKNNYITTGGLAGTNGIAWSGNVASQDATKRTMFDATKSVVTGVELGKNTDNNGKVYLKVVNDGNSVQVLAYKSEKMDAGSLVAKSEKTGYGFSKNITLDAVTNSDGTASTGLGIILATDMVFDDSMKGTTTGNFTFENLGARIFSTEYGSEHFVKVTQDKGAIFTSFDNPGDDTRTLLDSGEKGTTKLIYGQDATVGVNGKEVRTNGLELEMANQDLQASFTFNAGKVGSTTIAQVGYDVGSIFTRAGALNLGENVDPDPTDPDALPTLSGYLCNAGHNTNESLGEFRNGMQLQLGEGAGDQNRTVVSLRSMTTENIGRIVRGGYWDTSNPSVWTEKTFTLKDIQGGGAASLRSDPTLTMAIIDKAIDDVAGQRATIGAMQSNLLQTNANNLEVTLENITKTESGIRDADMASEMAEFTKNQVLQNAAMSMMGQANQQSQSALQLLN